MSRFRPATFWLALLAAAPLLCTAAGCQTAARHEGARAAATSHEPQPVDALTQSDAQRAKAAIESNQRDMSGERRPFERESGRPVDQPRVGDRR